MVVAVIVVVMVVMMVVAVTEVVVAVIVVMIVMVVVVLIVVVVVADTVMTVLVIQPYIWTGPTDALWLIKTQQYIYIYSLMMPLNDPTKVLELNIPPETQCYSEKSLRRHT